MNDLAEAMRRATDPNPGVARNLDVAWQWQLPRRLPAGYTVVHYSGFDWIAAMVEPGYLDTTVVRAPDGSSITIVTWLRHVTMPAEDGVSKPGTTMLNEPDGQRMYVGGGRDGGEEPAAGRPPTRS